MSLNASASPFFRCSMVSFLALAASLPNGGFGSIAKLCKPRFLRSADLDALRSIWVSLTLGLNGRFHLLEPKLSQVQLKSGIRPLCGSSRPTHC
ncbi:hypothetical protein [Pseudophaeobacter leonis]|uniref:hypothetical protein n=1 Tax=Pseudophaeobacter leonis TaxID=1144477 RepID=UPI00111C2A51|nr:hypothetical protein [Pseudophaeobacter leonis]